MNYAGHHVISTTTVPTTTNTPLAVGYLWSDPSDNSLKICTSVSPVTFAAVGGGSVTDANVSFSDITTGDASSTKHGFMPKLPFTVDAGSLSSNTPFQFKETWNNGAVTFYGMVVDCTVTSVTQAFLQAWRKGGVEQASLRHDGLFSCQSIALATNITVPGDVAIGNGGACRISDGTDYTYLKRVTGAGFKVQDSGSTYRSFESLYDRFGSGTPEGAVTAPVGAIFHRTDGGAGTSFYVKESGSGNTGWVAK